MDANFINVLSHHGFIGSDIEVVRQNCVEKSIKKSTVLLKQKERQSFIWFNSKGLFKYYYIDFEGNEKIKHFAVENDFVLSISALIENEESKFFIEAMEDAVIVEIPVQLFWGKVKESQVWKDMFNKQLVASILRKEEREAELLIENAENRYLNFLKKYPELANRLKIYEISAYLGINHAHLSRIRRKIAEK